MYIKYYQTTTQFYLDKQFRFFKKLVNQNHIKNQFGNLMHELGGRQKFKSPRQTFNFI